MISSNISCDFNNHSISNHSISNHIHNSNYFIFLIICKYFLYHNNITKTIYNNNINSFSKTIKFNPKKIILIKKNIIIIGKKILWIGGFLSWAYVSLFLTY